MAPVYADPADPATEHRLDQITQAVFAIAALDFSKELPLADDGSRLDGVAAAVNMLKEEILEYLARQRRSEDALRRKEDQLRQAQKMEAIGRLAGGVAHDFNNLLSVILSYAELAMADLETGHPLRADLSEIKAAGDRAANLTRQLLLFSRQHVADPKVLHVSEVIRSMESMSRRLLGEDIELRCRLDAGGAINTDAGLIEQVIMNLVVNARDAMPHGGSIVIETTDVELDNAFVETHLASRAGRHVRISVRDTGTGMDEATITRIFEPFFTTKPRDKGTGLGLSTVFGIVQQCGGSIYVASEPGQGTTFEIYVPSIEADVRPSVPRTFTDTLRGTETILLVEDNDQVRQVTDGILRRQGYNVIEARGGGEAILLFENHGDSIALVITDVIMPHLSGPQLVQRLRSMRPDLSVLYISGYTDDAILRHGITETAHFLQKPLTPSSVGKKVRAVLDSTGVALGGGRAL